MATLLVGYDLDKPGQDYTKLVDKLNSFPAHWHCLDSTWMVVADLTPEQLRDQLQPLIDQNDKLLVIDVSNDSAAWVGFNEKCSSWIKNNL